MYDFNTMFDEQMMAQDYSDGSYRILEAMLKRDNLEIQYRKQGYSESQIAQFHEAATAQINEALDSSREYQSVSGAWKQGSGFGKFTGAVKAIGHNIIAWIKRVYDWIKGKCKAAWVWIKKQWDKIKAWWNSEGKKKNPGAKVEAPKVNQKEMRDLQQAGQRLVDELNQKIRTFNSTNTDSSTEPPKSEPPKSEPPRLSEEPIKKPEIKPIEVPVAVANNIVTENKMYIDFCEKIIAQILTTVRNNTISNNQQRMINLVRRMQAFVNDLTMQNIRCTQNLIEQALANDKDTKARNNVIKVIKSINNSAIESLTNDLILESYELEAEAGNLNSVLFEMGLY